METQRASLSLGRWSLWLLLLGLVLPSASAQDLSYREAVLRAVDQFNEKSSEANLFRLLELDPPPKDVSWGGARISGSLSCGAREVRSPCAWRGGARPGKPQQQKPR